MTALFTVSVILLTGTDGYLQLVGALIIFLVVLVITAFVTRYVGGVQKSLGQGKNIKVIDTSKIAPNKYLQIVKVGEQFFCIGITQEQIAFLSEIDGKGLVIEDENQNMTFADLLQKVTEKHKNKNVFDTKLTDEQVNDINSTMLEDRVEAKEFTDLNDDF